ncbi:MAG: riboflavin synthase [Thermodesulfobacteriota bacterium]
MFTGIVEDIGRIDNIIEGAEENSYVIEVNKIDINELSIGESIAVNGACLTVISLDGRQFRVAASHETLNKTNLSKLQINSNVNLERALLVSDRLGGHIVTGHIDGTAEVQKVVPVGESIEFWFKVSDEMKKYFVAKGSVAVDGISLTINEVKDNNFSVNIIPHTQVETIIGGLGAGDLVNIECDILGKYVEKLLKADSD